MSDTQVSISFGGSTSEFEAAAQRAVAAMRSLTDGVNTLTARLAASTQGLTAATPAMVAVTKATENATAAVNQMAPATKTAPTDMQALTTATAGVSRESRPAAEAVQGVSKSTRDVADAAKHAGVEINSGVTRELVVLGHEVLNGNFSRIPGSFVVLAERIHLTGLAMAGLVIGIASAAIAAAHLVAKLNEIGDAKRSAEAGGTGGLIKDTELDAAVAATRKLEGISTEAAGRMVAEYARVRGMTKEVLTVLTNDTALYAERSGVSLEAAAKTIAHAYELQTGAAKDLFKNTRASAETVAAFDKAIENSSPIEARAILLRELARSTREVRDQNLFGGGKKRALEQALRQQQQFFTGKPGLAGTGTQPEPEFQSRKAIQETERLGAALKNISADWDAAGDTSWMRRQETALSQQNSSIIKAANTAKAATDGRMANEVDFWSKVLAGENLSVEQRRQVQQKLTVAEDSQRMAQLHALEGVARKSVQEQVAELSAEQAAHRENFEKWMEIEAQKLTILRTAYGEKSKEYLSELRAEETFQREHAARLQAMELQALERQNATAQKALTERVARLGAEVAEQQMTRAEELAISRDLTEAEGTEELRRLDTYIAAQDTATDQYKKALLQRADLYQTFQTRVAGIDKQIADEARRNTDRQLASYTSAFDRIGQQGESMASGLITGTMTWQRAEQQAASAVISAVVSMAGQVLARWAATELAKTMFSHTGAAQRVVVAQAEGASGLSVIGREIAQWLGIESAKTAASTTGASVRTGLEVTAATTEAVTGRAAALGQISANAAVAASGAYAAIAMIPYVGPALAPAAAATAFAGAESFAGALAVPSFAVGAWSLPGDMIAQLHKGEMIVPAFQAEAMRQGATVGGGGGASLHVTLQAIDTQSGAAFLNAQLPFLAKRLQQHLALNASARS
jgi:hypothetical protein